MSSETDTKPDNKPAAAAAAAPANNSAPEFLRVNIATSTPSDDRYLDLHGRDEVDHHIMSHRAQLEALNTQITNLDSTIALEQQKLRDSKSALEASHHARTRLLHLRSAMLHFVMELEARQAE